MGQIFYGYDHLFKVRLSMTRLLTVVNERKKLRNEYRSYLEDQYITRKKAEEKAKYLEEIQARRERGEETEYTPEELATLFREKRRQKREKLNKEKTELLERFDGASKQAQTIRKQTGSPPRLRAPLLQEQDMLMLAQGRVKLSQKEILKMHVKNHADLDLKQRRKVMAHIQS